MVITSGENWYLEEIWQTVEIPLFLALHTLTTWAPSEASASIYQHLGEHLRHAHKSMWLVPRGCLCAVLAPGERGSGLLPGPPALTEQNKVVLTASPALQENVNRHGNIVGFRVRQGPQRKEGNWTVPLVCSPQFSGYRWMAVSLWGSTELSVKDAF